MVSLTAVAVGLAVASSAPDFTRTCEMRAEGPAGQRELRASDVVLGRVAFIGLGRRLQLERARGADPSAKVPVVIESGRPVTVTLRRLGRTRARLDFDNEASGPRTVAEGAGQRAVRFEACPPDTPRFTDGRPLGEQTFYPGGFIVARRGCARLVARAPGEGVVRRRVALGVRQRRC